MSIPVDVPKGLRFSHIYMYSEPTSDSVRARKRLGAYLEQYDGAEAIKGATQFLERSLGIEVSGGEYYLGTSFWTKAQLRDFLDAITLIHHYFEPKGHAAGAASWLAVAKIVFEEERLSFEIDEKGGVHRVIDPAFANVVAAAIAGLGKAKYKNALTEFEAAVLAMDDAPIDGKQAVRRVFSSAEGLFKQLFTSAPRLGAAELKQHLTAAIQARSDWDSNAKRSGAKALSSFADWADAAHFYRHEQGQAEPSQPPPHLAILLVSQGASFIRWLLDFDQAT